MKIIAFEVRSDEMADFEIMNNSNNFEITYYKEYLCQKNLSLLNGYDGIAFLGESKINHEILDAIAKAGIGVIATRTIGYDHIDIEYAKELGIKVCNSSYGPEGVADFTVMLMLLSLRHYKKALWLGQVNDYSLQGLEGREMKDLTIGIMGTGRIGQAVLKNLSGFGARLLAYDIHQNETAKIYATYVDLEQFYQECDIISLHMPYLKSTHHLINDQTISKMKDGIIIINCARGQLCNTESLIRGIENKKIGALGLDVVEGEEGIYYPDMRIYIIKTKNEKQKMILELKYSEEINKATSMLRKHEEKLSKTNSIHTLGMMASAIAHEFKNLLTPIFIYNEMLMNRFKDNNEIIEDLNEIKIAADNCLELSKNILLYSKDEVLENIQWFNSTEEMLSILNILKVIIPPNINLKSSINSESIYLCGNKREFKQIVLNICTNAYQSMEKNGGSIEVKYYVEDIKSVLIISDTGCGIKKEVISRIYEPFYTSKDSNGNGLGLSIVAELVKKINGNIQIESEENVGTIVKIEFNNIKSDNS